MIINIRICLMILYNILIPMENNENPLIEINKTVISKNQLKKLNKQKNLAVLKVKLRQKAKEKRKEKQKKEKDVMKSQLNLMNPGN